MARGGFIFTENAVEKMFPPAQNRHDAQVWISKGLVNRTLRARGRELIERDGEFIGPGPRQFVPVSFWEKVDFIDLGEFPWKNGRFTDGSGVVSFVDVQMNEADINELVAKRLALRDGPISTTGPKMRKRRNPSWGDWTAALAMVAYERRIEGRMDRQVLLDFITEKLSEWGFEEVAEPTVGPTARAVLDRFENNPPTQASELER